MTDEGDRVMSAEIVDGWLLVLTWTAETSITGEVAATAMQKVLDLDGGVRRPLLVVMHPRAEMTRAARSAFARFDELPRLGLLGNSDVERMVANVVLRIATYRIPVRYFTDRDEAVSWLAQSRPGTRTEHRVPPEGPPPDPLA